MQPMNRSSGGSNSRARDEALAWFVRLHSGDAKAADKLAHKVWLASAPDNRSEYAKLDAVWADLDALGDPRPAMLEPPAAKIYPTRRLFLAGGAGALAASAAYLAGVPAFLSGDHVTATGELRDVSLSDGSVVRLDAGSSIAVHLTDRERSVELLKGRAFFDVAKDTSRPFSVVASRGKITALGTRFIVHRWADDVSVAVDESAVSVQMPEQGERVLRAGQALTYDERAFGDIVQADIWSETAWLHGKLIFEDRPLRQVLSDVNRYRPGVIRVASNSLLDMRVSGVFDVREPDGVLDAIVSTLPVRSIELSPYLVILYPA